MRYDIIIAGGGMVGLAAALACAREGMRVCVVEKGRHEAQLAPAFDGRVSAIALGSARFLGEIGAWDGMKAHACPILDIRITDGDSRLHLHYDHREVGEEPMGYIVENRHTRFGLIEAVRGCALVDVLEEEEVAAFEADAACVAVRLKSGAALSAALLLAAEGKESPVRAMAGIGVRDKSYRQTAIVCTVIHEKPHRGHAQERFLPAGPFAILPMLDEKPVYSRCAERAPSARRSSLVWTEKADYAPGLLALPRAALNDEMRRRFGDYLGAVEIAGDVFSYPLGLRYATRLAGPRLALIGDAGHAIHPIAGQGVNVGFRDVAALVPILARHIRLGLDIGAAIPLREYEKARQFDMHSMIAATDSINALFSNGDPVLRTGRRLGLAAVNKLPPLRKIFMKHAMGV